jgi:L-fuconolactonase
MIVDAHLHIWRPAPDYPNPGQTHISPHSDVPVEMLSEYMAEYGVDRAVLVQPRYPGENNSYVADCAAAEPDKYAAVCVVNPDNPAAPDRLRYWVNERGCKGLRLRPRIPGEGSSFGQPEAFPLWESAAALGVVINILAGPEHLPAVGHLANRFPNVAVILDHMAHPDPACGVESPAFQTLLDLARHPNVFVKTTGYYYYSRQRYPYTDCHEFFRALYDCYGAGRLIWGTDFPHVLLTTGYRRSLLMLERFFTFISQAEHRQIMGENAAALYWRT